MIRNCLVLLTILPMIFSEIKENIDCYGKKTFKDNLPTLTNYFISKTKFRIFFSKDNLVVTNIIGTKEVSILLSNTTLVFAGKLMTKGGVEMDRIDNAFYYGQIKGSAVGDLLPGRYFQNCSILLGKMEVIGNTNIELEINHLIQKELADNMNFCLCNKIESLLSGGFVSLTKIPTSVRLKKRSPIYENNFKPIFDSRLLNYEARFNSIIDSVLSEVMGFLEKSKADNIKLPGLDKTYPVDLFFFDVDARAKLKDGFFKGMASFKRENDAAFEFITNKFTATGGLRMDYASLGYGYYYLQFIASVSGDISGSISDVGLRYSISVDYNKSPWEFKVNYFDIVKRGSVRVRITGLTPFTDIASWIGSMLLDWFVDSLIKQMQKIINKSIKKH